MCIRDRQDTVYTYAINYPYLQKAIIKEIARNGDKVTELLEHSGQKLDQHFLNQALETATRMDNHVIVGKLVMKGATNVMECIRIAKEGKKSHARAMLLLIMAAQTGNVAIVHKLFGEPAPDLENKQDYEDDGFLDVLKAVLSGNVSTIVPIEIAHRSNQARLREEILMKTDVNQEEGYVYWDELQLHQLEVTWLRKIAWVKQLRLARNGFKSLPPEMATYLKQVHVIMFC